VNINNSDYDGVYDSDYDGVYDEKILTFAIIPRSRKEIMDMLGIIVHSKNQDRHITPLLEKGLLAMTLPDKPKSPNQKYVTTEKGKLFAN
jgi:ATP-dependent DNA helicase RecG